MPFKILKRGKEYILKSPTREYKHKSLAKAKHKNDYWKRKIKTKTETISKASRNSYSECTK
jgi:hypothetical protein